MPQVFQVLKCYKCLVFQVHQTKKTNKFQCKMCGEKQSIKRHYGLGNGQECRKHVQKLNGIRGEIDESKNNSDFCSKSDTEEDIPSKPVVQNTQSKNKSSKWSDFIEPKEVSDITHPNNDTMYLNDTEVVLELPKKRSKILGSYTKNHNNTTCQNKSDYEGTNNQNKIESPPTLEVSKTFRNADTRNDYACNKNKHLEYFELCPDDIKQERSISDHPECNLFKSTLESCNVSCNTANILCEVKSYNPETNYLSKECKKMIPPAINKNSKWAKFAVENNEDEIDLIKHKENVVEKPVIATDSPVEFIEPVLKDSNSDCKKYLVSENSIIHSSKVLAKTKQQMLFALCDDEDLDDYLAI